MTLEQIIKAEGRADLLLRQLELKFGRVPEPAVQRIRAGRIDELDRWGERILTANSLEAVLDG